MNVRNTACMAAILAACLITPTFAQDVFDLSLGFKKGQVVSYDEKNVTTTVQQMMGEERSNTFTITTRVKLEVEDVAEDGAVTLISTPEEVTMDGPQMGGRGPGGGGRDGGDPAKELIGKRTKVVLDATGRTVRQEALDPLPGRRGGRMQAFRYGVLPPRPVGLGDTWKSSGVDTIALGFSRARAKFDVTLTAEAKELHRGRECLKITYTGKQDIAGSGEMRGNSFEIEGTGTITGTFHVDLAAGGIVDEETVNEVQAVIAMTGQMDFSMPMAMTARSTRSLRE